MIRSCCKCSEDRLKILEPAAVGVKYNRDFNTHVGRVGPPVYLAWVEPLFLSLKTFFLPHSLAVV